MLLRTENRTSEHVPTLEDRLSRMKLSILF